MNSETDDVGVVEKDPTSRYARVAFQILRIAQPVQELGNRIAERMKSKGPYLALHLRMEMDVWVRTGCLPCLIPEFDEIVNKERIQRTELLTARSNMTYLERKMAGLCPLIVVEVTRQPLGGKEALLPLIQEY